MGGRRAVRRPPSVGRIRAERGQFLDNWRPTHVRVHGSGPWKEPNLSSFLLCVLFSHALGLPRGTYLSFLRPTGWETADWQSLSYAVRCVRSPVARNPALTTMSEALHWVHVQEYLAGPNVEWENCLTRWTLGARNGLEGGVPLPLFQAEVAAPPRGMRLVLESAPATSGWFDQVSVAAVAPASHQNEGDRDATPIGQSGPP